MKVTSFLVLAAAAQSLLAADEARLAFERFADVAVNVPPEIVPADLARYSTNVLDFALNNGLAVTRGGRLWVSWIAGGDGPESFTVASWSDDGGDTWTDVKFVIDGHDGTVASRTNIIGTFWLDPDGRLRCYTDQSILHFDGRAGFWEAVCANPDDPNPIWSKFRRIGDGHVMNKPVVLKDGTWALSAYLNGTWQGKSPLASFPGAFPQLDPMRGATCFVSADRGRTWERRGTVIFPGGDWQESLLCESKDGEALRVFARVIDGKHGCTMSAVSGDKGRTWTKAHRLPSFGNTNARFQIARLKSGRLLAVKHGKPYEVHDAWCGRVNLTAYVSDNDGQTWKGGLLLDPGNGTYPDWAQGADGTIYVTSDHGRGTDAEIRLHRFTEEDVLAGKIVSPRGRIGIIVSKGMSSAHNKKARRTVSTACSEK